MLCSIIQIFGVWAPTTHRIGDNPRLGIKAKAAILAVLTVYHIGNRGNGPPIAQFKIKYHFAIGRGDKLSFP